MSITRRGFMGIAAGLLAAAVVPLRKAFGWAKPEPGPEVPIGWMFYVDGHAPEAKDAAGHGLTPDKPFKTYEYALSQCEPWRNDTIYVLPGHHEICTSVIAITDLVPVETGLTFRGIPVVWDKDLGDSADRPRFTFEEIFGD